MFQVVLPYCMWNIRSTSRQDTRTTDVYGFFLFTSPLGLWRHSFNLSDVSVDWQRFSKRGSCNFHLRPYQGEPFRSYLCSWLSGAAQRDCVCGILPSKSNAMSSSYNPNLSSALLVLLTLCISKPTASLLIAKSISLVPNVGIFPGNAQLSTRNTERHLELRYNARITGAMQEWCFLLSD